MKIVLKNSSIELNYRPLTWIEYEFDVDDRINYYIHSSGEWTNGGYCYLIPRTPEMEKLQVSANSNKLSLIAFLTSNSHNYNSTPDYCVNTGLNRVPVGTQEEFSIPDDCQYIYVMSGTVPEDSHLPAQVKIGE
jgi:hypothetical protein